MSDQPTWHGAWSQIINYRGQDYVLRDEANTALSSPGPSQEPGEAVAGAPVARGLVEPDERLETEIRRILNAWPPTDLAAETGPAARRIAECVSRRLVDLQRQLEAANTRASDNAKAADRHYVEGQDDYVRAEAAEAQLARLQEELATLSRPADREQTCRDCGGAGCEECDGTGRVPLEPSRPDPASLTPEEAKEAADWIRGHRPTKERELHVGRVLDKAVTKLRALSAPTAGTEDEDG